MIREDDLRAGEQLRLLIDNVPEAVVSADGGNRITGWNREAKRIFGWDEEQAIGESMPELLLSEIDRGAYEELLHNAIAKDAPVTARLDGLHLGVDIVPVEMRLVPAGGSLLAFFRDATDQVRAERESRVIEAIANASSDAILGVTITGNIVSWNPAAERIFGWTAEEAIGTPVGRIFARTAAESRNWLLDNIARGVSIESTLVELARADGTLVRAFVSTRPIDGDGGAAVILRDASDHLAARNRVDTAEHLASLGRLARAVGHEFNNILMGIQPFVDVLKRQELNATSLKALDHIRTSIERGRRVTTEISRFARASAPPELRDIPVQAWLESFEKEIRAALTSGIQFETHVENPDATMHGDPGKLKEVVLSLAANACDAMTAGGTLTLTVRDAEPWIELLIADTGTGIDPQSVEQVFEPLFTTRRGRVGLGLSTVEQIVRRHGGTVSLSSELGEGTTVRILLPPGGHVPAQRAETPRGPAKRVRKVLLVEDDVSVAAGLSASLGAAGVEVDVVHTGSSVLPAVRAFRPEVVVLDVRLPDADGFEVFHRIAEAFPGLPVIFSSGHADVADAASAMRNTHVGFLRKPYATEELLQEIERVSA